MNRQISILLVLLTMFILLKIHGTPPLFHFVHRSDFLQHHGGPLGIAGLLVARVSCGIGGKDGVGLRCNVDGEAFAEANVMP